MDGTSFWRKRSQYPSSSARTLSSVASAALFSRLFMAINLRMGLIFLALFSSFSAAAFALMTSVARQTTVATLNLMVEIFLWVCRETTQLQWDQTDSAGSDIEAGRPSLAFTVPNDQFKAMIMGCPMERLHVLCQGAAISLCLFGE